MAIIPPLFRQWCTLHRVTFGVGRGVALEGFSLTEIYHPFAFTSARRNRQRQTGNGAQPALDDLDEVVLSLDDGGQLLCLYCVTCL